MDEQRIKTIYDDFSTSGHIKTRYYFGSYEKEIDELGNITNIDYVYTPTGLTLILKNGTQYYTHTDLLGSIERVTNATGGLVSEYAYTPWGGRILLSGVNITDRGYTGHEHLSPFGDDTNSGFCLINMNGRIYDPVLGRFLSPDPYVQAPDFTQSFNRYTYCLNNPFRYTDPSGEIFWLIPAAVYGIFFTEPGYEIQKYVSPVAFKVDLRFGTHQKALGFDVSVGIPKLSPYAKRWEYGTSYFWKNYGDYQGWETRKGTEWSILGVYTQSTTQYTAGEFTQTVGRKSIGIPSFLGIDVSNDLWGDGGDRFRTSHIRINAGLFRIGQALFTGDPGLDNSVTYDDNGKETYKKSPYGNPDKYRHGTLYIGFGPVEIGWDSEGIRSFFQNGFHSLIGSPHFKDLRDTPQGGHSRPYIQFGWGPMW